MSVLLLFRPENKKKRERDDSMLKKGKRFIAFMLALTIAAPSVVWADTGQEIDVSALRVSEAFAAKHPSGVFEVLSPYIITGEGKEFDFYVLRRGGTDGDVGVNIKAIEISAKYGDDFILQEKDALGFYHDLKKSEDNPTILETQIEKNKDVLFTTDRLASGAGFEIYALDENVSGAAVEVEAESNDPDDTQNIEAPAVTSIDEALKNTEETPVTAYSDDMGDYTSALHKMRDEALGKTTPVVTDSAEHTLDDFFEPQNKEQLKLMNDAAAAFDGLAYTVDFADGEAYKVIHVKVTDDDEYEAQEAISLALYDPTNGAELGDQCTSNIYINDNDNVEKCDISFALDNYQVFSDADGVTVTLKREGNANDYVSVYVSTLADTAKADEDYTPVMGDIMFLPGETEKNIYIPILKDKIAEKHLDESIAFDITAETEDNANVTGKKTRIEILPFTNTDNKALINVYGTDESGNVTTYSDDAPLEVFDASSDYFTILSDCSKSYSEDGFPSYSENWWSTWINRDLTGVEHISWEWKNDAEASAYNRRQKSTITIGGYAVEKQSTWSSWQSGSIDGSTLSSKGLRKSDVECKISVYRDWGNPMNLQVRNFRAYYTSFSFIPQNPDKLKYYVYKGTGEGDRIDTIEFLPATTSVSQSNFIKNNYLRAYGNLNDNGRKYGCSIKNVTVTGNNKSITKSSGEGFYADSDFIKNYIYNGDQSKSRLTAKANVARTERVNKIHIAAYENGVVKIGDKVYNNTDLSSSVWYKGDKLRLSVTPNQGYHVAGITAGGVNYKQGEDISLADNMTIEVKFARDDNSVSITHALVSDNPTETLAENIVHGKVAAIGAESDYKPMTIEQFVDTLSDDEKSNILLSTYQKYVEENGLADKFTNEIPQLYLDLTGYKVSNKNFDYKARLKAIDYKRLIAYFENGGVPNAALDTGLKAISDDLYDRLCSEKNKYRSAMETVFQYDYSAFGYCYITYNGVTIKRYYYTDLMSDFCNALYRDGFSHVDKRQAEVLGKIMHKPNIDLSDSTIREIYALTLVNNSSSFNAVDEDTALSANVEPAYNEYREKYRAENQVKENVNYSIDNLTTGDTVNLIAQLEDGYTCVWVYDDSAKTKNENKDPIYTVHIGDSFSFEVQDRSATVKYYFVPVNEKVPNTIIRGRIIKPAFTLRTLGSKRVDINDSSTYKAYEGMDVTVGAVGSTSQEIDGKKYNTYATTDKNGYFEILVPHAMAGRMTNLIMADGEKTFVKHTVVTESDKLTVYAIPYQDDNIWVDRFEFSCSEDSKTGIDVVDKDISLEADLKVTDGYGVTKVVLRSYTAGGDLIKAWEMNPQGSYKYKTTFNAKEYLRDGGRLTIEPYDAYGRGTGQVESGCKFYEPPKETNVSMPSIPEMGGAEFDVFGGIDPSMDVGEHEMTPEKSDYGEDKFELAILSGRVIKSEIAAAEEGGETVFSEGTASERVARLTATIDPYSSVIPITAGSKGENLKSKPEGSGKVSARGGKLGYDVGLDLGFYIRLDKKRDEGGTVRYYYSQLYILFGVNANIKKDFQIFLGPVPCYITIGGGITVKGLVGMAPQKGVDPKVTFDGIKMDTDVLREGGMDVAGLILINPRLSLGAGVGVRGVLSLGVSGKMDLKIVYEPWIDGAGTIHFGVNIDIDLAFIPITFEIIGVTLGMFYTEEYYRNSWLNFDEAVNKENFEYYVKNGSKIKTYANDSVETRGTMGAIARGHGNTLESPLKTFSDEDESALRVLAENNVRGTLKHPKPQLLHLGGGKQILFYLGDDSSRADYDCQAVYYALYDGSNWGQPQLVDDDGTTDMDFSAVQAGDKVIIVHSDLNKQYGNSKPDIPEYLGSTDMSICVFDENGNKGDEKQLTKADGFANTMPRIAYDETTGRTLIAYLATDYNDSRADFGYKDITQLNRFLNNAYSTVCYKMLDREFNEVGYSQNEATYLAYEDHYGEGSLDNQRFVPLAANTLNINEMTANTYKDKVYITYTVDKDGNSETSEDMEIYASVVDINNNSSVGPVRLTTNDVQDSNPQTVEYDGKVYLYWNQNNAIVYTDLCLALGSGVTQTDEGYTASDMDNIKLEENAEAAQSFRVSYEPNGRLYLIWNALDNYTELGENGEETPIVKRVIYMRVYDPHYSDETFTDEETGETRHTYMGEWGSATKFDVPDDNMTMYNEQTFTALDKDTAMCAFRRFRWEEDENGNVKEAANSDLVIHRYHVVSSLKITDMYSDPTYPLPEDDAVLHITAENVGVLPSEKVTFKAKLTDETGNVTDLGEDVVNAHLSVSSNVEGTFTYKVPENGDTYKFTVTAYEDNYTEKAAVFEKSFEKAPVIENIAPESTRTNNAYENIKATFINKGNKATGEMTFKISATNNGPKAQLTELINKSVASLEPGETFNIDETANISECWGTGDTLSLFVTLENGEEELYSDTSYLNRIDDTDIDITDIIINDNDESTVEVNAGESAYPNFEIVPSGAASTHKLVYSISDSSIADIDPSNGSIYGKKEGTATITVTAIKKNYSIFVDEDNDNYDSAGNLVLFDKDGVAGDIELDTSGEKTVMTKQLQIKVSGTLSETTETTTDNATETTTKSSSSRSSGGGGGGSSSRTASKTTEATTEITTANTEESSETTSETIVSDDYNGFVDVKDMWCEEIVNTLRSLGLVNGRTEDMFAPNDNLTRAELVQLLANISGADLSAYKDSAAKFTDVNENAWYYAAVMWAEDNNIVYGIGNDMFAPDISITREDTAAIIYRYLGSEASGNSSFSDRNDISGYALDAVDTLSAQGIINGYPDNTFRPKNTITRAETAAILYGVNEK